MMTTTTEEIHTHQCYICGNTYQKVEGLKSHIVEEHFADPNTINNAPGKFFIYYIIKMFISFY